MEVPVTTKDGVAVLIEQSANSQQLDANSTAPLSAPPTTHSQDHMYRTPDGLHATDLPPMRALFIGACHTSVYPMYLPLRFRDVRADHILHSFGPLPEEPPRPLENYSFQVIMMSFRAMMSDAYFMRTDMSSEQDHIRHFEYVCELISMTLQQAMSYRERKHLPTLVSNYAAPQQNNFGRLMPRYDFRNPVYFVERINQFIATEISTMKDVYLLDFDQISANFGRKYCQDDSIAITSHHFYLSDLDHPHDQTRIAPPIPLSHQNVVRSEEFINAVCNEIHATMRTLRQIDQVKLIIVDLDDTVWRGVIAEDGISNFMITEGWPVGFAEALTMLKRRGILLAIASKNSEERIRSLWPDVYGGRLELDDFVSIKINWEPKVSNIEQILADTNLLPRNVVFIDDNPVERDAVKAAFPDMRVIGDDPYELRSLLLWAPETQVPYITNESVRRTEMVQAQVQREAARKRLSREEFLQTLEIKVHLNAVRQVDDEKFPRALELINKSNQFNTTGKRWSVDEVQNSFNTGTTFWTFEVEDRFTRYGLVGVAIVEAGLITQFVMSCRVVGLEVEKSVITTLAAMHSSQLAGRYIATDANHLCKTLFADCGFLLLDDGLWHADDATLIAAPAHITVRPFPE